VRWLCQSKGRAPGFAPDRAGQLIEVREPVSILLCQAVESDALEEEYDGQFRSVFHAIKPLMAPPRSIAHKIGFRSADR
jgi:hypothetical protein